MIDVFSISLSITAPFLSRSNDTAGFGIDAPLSRLPDNSIYIPGSHIVGKLVEAYRGFVETIGEESVEGGLFAADMRKFLATDVQNGSPESDTSTGRETRRRIGASDFVLQTQENPSIGVRTRIAIDPIASTVSEGMMQVIEQPFDPGSELVFHGDIRVRGGMSHDEALRLSRALRWMTQVGALRSVGFGAMKGISINRSTKAVDLVRSLGQRKIDERVALVLEVKDPLCVGERRNSPNSYESAKYIPGGAIKGAIASQILASLGLDGILTEHANSSATSPALRELMRTFDRLRIRHGLPIPLNENGIARSGPVPLSMVRLKDKFVDIALCEAASGPVLLDDQPPTSMFDWKPTVYGAAQDLLGITEPSLALRIRTQIDRRYRAAHENRLFGVGSIVPGTHKFVSIIDFPSDADAGLILAALSEVLGSGLSGLGRGGAFAECSFVEAPSDPAPAVAGDFQLIVLKSHALLRPAAEGRVDLLGAYADVFSDQKMGLPEGLKLHTVFADEFLAGGSFMANRLKNNGVAGYRPWLLTRAGSVFVFRRVAGDSTLPQSWFDAGLPIPRATLASYGLGSAPLHQMCPYLPENGYAEVAPGVKDRGGKWVHESYSPGKLGIRVNSLDVVEV